MNLQKQEPCTQILIYPNIKENKEKQEFLAYKTRFLKMKLTALALEL